MIDPQDLRDLQEMEKGVIRAAELREGSYLQRNPSLGRMMTCPLCGHRKLSSEKCCSAKWLVAMPVGSQPRSAFAKKRKTPRLSRNRPPMFLLHQRLVELERDLNAVPRLQDSVQGLRGFWTPQRQIAPQNLAAFVEKVILREKKDVARRRRTMQENSRRINRGL